MNSSFSMDDDSSSFGDDFEDDFDKNEVAGSLSSSSSVVLVLRDDGVGLEDGEVEKTSDQLVPFVVGNVPLYLATGEDGKPVYIRQYTEEGLEALMSPNGSQKEMSFGGFSDNSGSTFEGFGNSMFEGFEEELSDSEESQFDGFSEESAEVIEGRQKIEFIRKWQKMSQTFNDLELDIFMEDSNDSLPETEPSTSKGNGREINVARSSKGEMSSGKQKHVRQVVKHGQEPRKRGRPSKGVLANNMVVEETGKKSASPISISPKRMPKHVTAKGKTQIVHIPPTVNVKEEIEIKDEIDDKESIGLHCNQVGCTITWLESMTTKYVTVTNGIVFELDEFAKKINWERSHVAKWILRLRGILNIEPTEEDLDKIHVVLKRRKALAVTLAGKKKGHLQLQEFDTTAFVLPSDIKKEIVEVLIPEVESSSRSFLGNNQSGDNLDEQTLSIGNKSATGVRQGKAEVYTGNSIRNTLDDPAGSIKVGEVRVKRKSLKSTIHQKVNRDALPTAEQSTPKVHKTLGVSDEINTSTDTLVSRTKRKVSEDSDLKAPRKKFKDSRVSFHCRGNHIYPHFNESDLALGAYCRAAGLTINDLNSCSEKDILVTQGLVLELYRFYRDRECTVTSLAQRLLKLKNKSSVNLVSMIVKITSLMKKAKKIGGTKGDFHQAEFQYPRNYKGPDEPSNAKFRAPGWECKIKQMLPDEENKQRKSCRLSTEKDVVDWNVDVDVVVKKKTVNHKTSVKTRPTLETNSDAQKGSLKDCSSEMPRRRSSRHSVDENAASEVVDLGTSSREISKNLKKGGLNAEKQKNGETACHTKDDELTHTTQVLPNQSFTMVAKGKSAKVDTDGSDKKREIMPGCNVNKLEKQVGNVDEMTGSEAKSDTDETMKTQCMDDQSDLEKIASMPGSSHNVPVNKGKVRHVSDNIGKLKTEVGNDAEKDKSKLEIEDAASLTSLDNESDIDDRDDISTFSDDDDDEKEKASHVMNTESKGTDKVLTMQKSCSVDIPGLGEKDDGEEAKEKVLVKVTQEGKIDIVKGTVKVKAAEIDKVLSSDMKETEERLETKVSVAMEETKLRNKVEGNVSIDKERSGEVKSSESIDLDKTKEVKTTIFSGNEITDEKIIKAKVSFGGEKIDEKKEVKDNVLVDKEIGNPNKLPKEKRDKQGGNSDLVSPKENQESGTRVVREMSRVGLVEKGKVEKGKVESPSENIVEIRRGERERILSARVKEFHSVSEFFEDDPSFGFYGSQKSPPVYSSNSPTANVQPTAANVQPECPKKASTGSTGRTYLNRNDHRVSFSLIDGRIIPYFKNTSVSLGEYCDAVGITVSDLNTSEAKDVFLTRGAVIELVKYYRIMNCTMTSLADRLLRFKKLYLPSILNLVARFGPIMKYDNNKTKMGEEFVFPPNGEYNVDKRTPNRVNPKTKNKKGEVSTDINSPTYTCEVVFKDGVKKSKKKKKKKNQHDYSNDDDDNNVPLSMKAPQRMKFTKKGHQKKESTKKSQQKRNSDASLAGDQFLVDKQVEKAKGKEGSVTRADIVILYTKWLQNKSKVGSNVFVTDLLRDVTMLMEERKVQAIRIPAGTLMSSSVKLYEEYKRMWNTSKSDAMMYLEDDWVEDIQYLVSITQTSRRNTTEMKEGDGNVNSDESKPAPKELRIVPEERDFSDSGSERSLQIDESYVSDDTDLRDFSDCDTTSAKRKKCVKPKGRPASKVKKTKLKESIESPAATRVFTPVKSCPPVIVEKKMEIEKIMDYKCTVDENSKPQISYLVRWKELGPEKDSWISEKELQCPKALEKSSGQSAIPVSGKSEVLLKWQPLFSEYAEQLKSLESGKDKSSELNPSRSESDEVHDKENAPHNISNGKVKSENGLMTNGELLFLYDNWRHENQTSPATKKPFTINVKSFIETVEKAMLLHGVKPIYSDFLLQTCFILTLIRKMLSSEEALREFLGKSCLPALESSRTSQETNKKKRSSSKLGVLSANFVKLKAEFVKAKETRSTKRMQIGIVEDELEGLERSMDRAQGQPQFLGGALRQEISRLGKSLGKLKEGNNLTENFRQENPEKYEKTCKDLRDCGVPENNVGTIMDSVLNVIGKFSDDFLSSD